MKKFLTTILIVACVAYLLAFGLDYIISRGLASSAGHPHQAWREIKSGDYASDIVIMGTSRALEHYDPQVIDSITGMTSYNLGMGGYSVNLELMKYRYYTHYNPLPKYLLYDVDHILLSIGIAVHQHQSEQFLPLFYNPAIRGDLRNVGYSWIDATIPMARYWGYQIHSKRGIFEFLNLKHYCVYPSYRGHMPDPDSWDPTRLHISDTISRRVDAEALDMFENFVAECKHDGVQLIFVTSPVYYRYVEMCPSWNQYIAYFDSVATANDIPYLNYMNDSVCRDSTFFNADVHLTPAGTKRFSEQLAKDLIDMHIL